MNDIPRQRLRDIIKRYGIALIEDPRRVQALLLDLCGQYRREIFVLVQAQEEAVAEDLLQIPDSVPLSMLVSQLANRLVENRALSPDAARWSVESWAFALGKPIQFTANPPDSDTYASKPADTITTNQERKGNSISSSESAEYNHSSILQYIPVKSEWPVDYYWQAEGQNVNSWEFIGRTPDQVLLPAEGRIKLAAHIPGDDLSDWISGTAYRQNVTCLWLDQPVSDAGISALEYFPNLKDLTVDNGESVTNQGFTHLQHLLKLMWLKLTWFTQIVGDGFAVLSTLKQIRELRLEWAHIQDEDYHVFANLPALEHLGVRECNSMRGTGLRYIRERQSITSLDLAGASELQDLAIQHISVMKQLKKLNLMNCIKLTGRSLSTIKNLPNLAYLNLGGIPGFNDNLLGEIVAMKNLTSLSVAHTGLSNTGLSRLKDMQSLAFLDLSGCDVISDRGLKYLRALPYLKHLNLNACKRLSTRAIDRLERPGLTIIR